MRSGWPHTEDGQGMYPGEQRQAPFGPEVSWSTGYPDLEYRDGDYRYAAPQAAPLPAAANGAHPYAAFGGNGYGDDGYTDPGYQGPAAQDAGIASTRTVRGFVESGQDQHYPGQGGPQGGYPQAGYVQPGYPEQYAQPGYGETRYADSSYAGGQIEMAYPATAGTSPASEEYHGAESYQQPWDYEQPLRYDGDEDPYTPVAGDYRGAEPGGGAFGYQQPEYDSAGYNGSEYSMPGINGPGYDLSGIIATSDFEAVGYDEPSYDRLAYDDPRYEDAPRYGDPQGYTAPPSSFETRFGGRRFDETRLDNLWLSGEDVRRESEAVGYGNDGFGDSPVRAGYTADVGFGSGTGFEVQAFDETRLDFNASAQLGIDYTRFDVPAFDETRLDNLRVTGPGPSLRPLATALAPSPLQPRSWAEETSLDHFADLDLTDEPLPDAFNRAAVRTLERQVDEDIVTRRAVGRRRGRSGDRRQWMALGAIAIVAAGAIGGVLMKFKFAGPNGPTHNVAAVQTVDGYTRSPILEKEMNVKSLATNFTHASGGQVSNVTSAVYEQGAGSSDPQIFMFVGGKIASSDASASVANFKQHYPNATNVSPGTLGGEAACTQTALDNEGVSMCVWFDNDTFGAVVSPTMTMAKLATTMDTVRPNLETVANSPR